MHIWNWSYFGFLIFMKNILDLIFWIAQKISVAWDGDNIFLNNISVNRPGWERRVIALARTGTRHIKNTRVVFRTPKILHGMLSYLFLTHWFSTFLTHLTPKLPSYRNQSIDLHCKSIDWLPYVGNFGF